MTHTPGFEETLKDLLAQSAKPESLGTWLKRRCPRACFRPAKCRPARTMAPHLAGYIVERVSGEPFEEYIARLIFAPLGMAHSTFVQPLPPALAPFMSQGYDRALDKPETFEMKPMAPAGALSASGDDIARFMLAHLNNGSFGGAQILEPETAMLMHSVAYQHTPGIPPWHTASTARIETVTLSSATAAIRNGFTATYI